nr:beta-fructofuranosidase, insoluble isoenzyme CWINV3-like [Physcomitrium patens]|eukprot:XP_024386996.1 beta-fructofuranosidase, insoluble isoenzyme CWINV3-like [Physcomitrella patens]
MRENDLEPDIRNRGQEEEIDLGGSKEDPASSRNQKLCISTFQLRRPCPSRKERNQQLFSNLYVRAVVKPSSKLVWLEQPTCQLRAVSVLLGAPQGFPVVDYLEESSLVFVGILQDNSNPLRKALSSLTGTLRKAKLRYTDPLSPGRLASSDSGLKPKGCCEGCREGNMGPFRALNKVEIHNVQGFMTLGLPYRTGYHFQPKGYWMNDPNGPVYYKGYYHLFYQYNPFAAIPGNIEWHHVVSKDLIRWKFLGATLKRDQWYDANGCFSGSITILDDGTPVILYTGNSFENKQVQARADPEDPSDPLLRKWVKAPYNPIAPIPPGYNSSQFRDPTEAWRLSDGMWRMLVGANAGEGGLIGTALLYKSTDFQTWNFSNRLHENPTTGMWECPDLFPVRIKGRKGLNASAVGKGVLHVLKVSLDLNKHDYYSVGNYLTETDTYKPLIAEIDTGIGLRYDYGKYYASKTFFDPIRQRRIVYGWTNESTSTMDDVAKGWAGLQSIPRIVYLDQRANTSLIQWPIEEVQTLRRKKITVKDVNLEGGEVARLMDVSGVQLDIEVAFKIPDVKQGSTPTELIAESGPSICSQKGASMRGMYGPFGLLVLASNDLTEQTAVYFYFVFTKKDGWKTLVCSDQSRSTVSMNLTPDKTTYGSYVRVYDDEKLLKLRLLVDHSVVETFAQGGRTVITTRVYPKFAQSKNARVFLFNNGSETVNVDSATVWNMATVRFVDFGQ